MTRLYHATFADALFETQVLFILILNGSIVGYPSFVQFEINGKALQ